MIEHVQPVAEQAPHLTEQIANWFTGCPKEIVVLIISMFPIVELRGAIPWALSTAMGPPLSWWTSYMLACLGRAALHAAQAAGSRHEHVISASAQFLSSPDLGPAQIVTEVDRVGGPPAR